MRCKLFIRHFLNRKYKNTPLNVSTVKYSRALLFSPSIFVIYKKFIIAEVFLPWSTERRKSLSLGRTVARGTVLLKILHSPLTHPDIARYILVFIPPAIGTDITMISGIFIRGHSFVQLHGFLKLAATRCGISSVI